MLALLLVAAGAAPLAAQDPAATADSVRRQSRAVFNDTAGLARIAAAREAPVVAVVGDPGPGPAGALLRRALAGRRLVVVGSPRLVLGRDVRVDSTLVVVGDLYTGARVRGDVIVLGHLYLRPGAVIEGRAVAIGGGVYPSSLARVEGGTLAYRAVAATARPRDGRPLAASRDVAVDLGSGDGRVEERLSLPGVYGLRLPLYDRVNGATLAFGPELSLDTGRVRVEPTVAWRTHLGAVDPALRVTYDPGWRTALVLAAGRGTFTNDAWIRTDLINSAGALAFGSDFRNYWRADRAELTLLRRIQRGATELTPFVGALAERSWSAARDTSTPAPWSVTGRNDPERIRRVNPGVTGGGIASALVGGTVRREVGDYRLLGVVRLEAAPQVGRAGRFVQATVDGSYVRPFFADRHLVEVIVHAVGTAADGATPGQRYHWLGGAGTIQTIPLLSRGGDQLLFAEGRYTVPVRRLNVPFLGEPRLSARAIVGAAGVGRLPDPVLNVGPRVTIGPLRADFVFDPSHPGDRGFNVGLVFAR